MSPLVHGLIAWLLAVLLLKNVHDRRLAVVAGVALDIDGIFILFDLDLYSTYHHTFGHSYIFGFLMAAAAFGLGRERVKVFVAALGAFSLHLLADIVGSNWGINPFYPFTDISLSIYPTLSLFTIYVVVNGLTTTVAMILMLWIMYKKQISPLEFISEKLDERFVSTYIYFIKYRCEICGKRAFTYCSECGKKVCSKHLKSLITFKCEECSRK